jgi:hypothetical protein
MIRKTTAILLSLGLLSSIVTTASAEEPAKRCLRIHSITGFSYVDEYHALLSGRTPRENYLVRFNHTCRDINFATRITTSFEGKLVCSPTIETIRTETDQCSVGQVQKVANKAEAKAIAAERAAEREARSARKKADRLSSADGS